MNEPQIELGARIRQLREQRGETQRSLADKAGVSYKTISKIEQGHSRPHHSTLQLIANGLGIHPREFLGRTVPHDPHD